MLDMRMDEEDGFDSLFMGKNNYGEFHVLKKKSFVNKFLPS